MQNIWTWIQMAFSAIGGFLGYFLGGMDGFLYALIAFVVIDYITGYEVTFYPFYSVPILLVLWVAGKPSAFGIAAISGVAWLLADNAAGHA